MDIIDSVEEVVVSLTVNGRKERLRIEPRTSLADALRGGLSVKGVKVGCEQGVCGSCTVLVDGVAMRSCLMLGVQVEGCSINTIEGLAKGKTLHPLQDAFRRHHALQCGFCSAGFLATAVALLTENPRPTRAEIREAISGNICRCTGYESIVDAISDLGVVSWAEGLKHG
jgi:aerobic-type carbon monoxide dehydrogenase small subunit (CoxS/CutS family)